MGGSKWGNKGIQPEETRYDSDVDMDASESGFEEQDHNPKEMSELDKDCELAMKFIWDAAAKIWNQDREDIDMEDASHESLEEEPEEVQSSDEDEYEDEDESEDETEDEYEDEDEDESDDGEEADDEYDEDDEVEEDDSWVMEGIPPSGIQYIRPITGEPYRKAPANVILRQERCDICGDRVRSSEITLLPCAHAYCSECIERLFQTAITDGSIFPPRCCNQSVVIDRVKHLLHQGLLGSYYQKKQELDSLSRIYCCKRDCSALIPIKNIKDEHGTCQQCGTELCIVCKFEAHGDDECPEDWELHDFLDFAAEKGWARCDVCGRVIERDFGCNHMICHCRWEFCFVCNMEWTSCVCDYWVDENAVDCAEEQGTNTVTPQAPGASIPQPRQNSSKAAH